MIYLLLILCIVFLLFVKVTSIQELYSPTFIASAMIAVGTTIYIAYYNTLQKNISLYTVSIIVLSLLALLIGEKVGKVFRKKYNVSSKCYTYILANKGTTFVVIAFMLVTLALRIIDARKYVGGFLNIIGIISHLRHYVMAGEYSVPAYLQYMTWIAEVLCYIYVYIYLRNRIICNVKEKINIIPIVLYALISLTGTGRTDLIKVVIALVSIGLFTLYEKNPYRGISFKTFRKIMLGLLIFGAVFFFIGSLRAKNSIDSTSNPIFDTVFSYIGAPLYGLDYQFKNHVLSASPYFGYWTLQEIYDVIGIEHGITPPHNLPAFRTVGTGISNIYTSIALPYIDYGIIGILISRFLIGFMFVFLFNRIMVRSPKGYSRFIGLVILIDLYYALFSYGIADRFKDILLYPPGIIRHTILVWLIARFVLRLKFVEIEK